MNIQRRQSIQKIIIDQAGQDRLILNDLILGYQGAQALAQLIPEYHSNIQHLQIKGNNIDSGGFQLIFAALMNCPHLKSIEAEWNSIGSSASGLSALCYLVQNLQFLQFIDLKNNRISHNIAEYICEIIQINNRSLKVIDLRWNQLGQIGAQSIYRALAHNSVLKYIGLDDNRISMNTLKQIQTMLKNVTRGTKQVLRPLNTVTNPLLQPLKQNIFPLSEDSYPSMDMQIKNTQIRAKIQNQQNEAEIYQSKLKIQIDKVLQKMKSVGLRLYELQLKYDSLNAQNLALINQLRETQRLLTMQKQRFIGIDKGLVAQKNSIRTDKYNMNLKIQSMMQKNVQSQQRDLQQIQSLMSEKYDKLQSIYRERVNKKRSNRDKLSELKQDIIKLKISKENAWDKITDTYQNTNKNVLEDRMRGLEELVAKSEFQLKSEIKRSQHLSQQLSSTVLKGLQKEQKFQSQIFTCQNQIKDLHNQMGTTNVQIQENNSKSSLLESSLVDMQAGVQMRRKYIKYIQSQTSVNIEIERLKQEQDFKGERILSQMLDLRVTDLEKAIRIEQGQHKMIRNQYDKLLSQIQNASKKTIQTVLFEV